MTPQHPPQQPTMPASEPGVIRPENPTARQADLICEAILREMSRAQRFSHAEDGWRALLNVRRIADAIIKESRADAAGKMQPGNG